MAHNRTLSGPEPRRVVLAAGGTAGHIMPALALAEAYRAARPGVDILFVGTRVGLEHELVPAAGHRLILVDGSPLYGVGWPGRAMALVRLAHGAAQAWRALREHRAEMVVGFGGFASAGALLAARSLGVPTVVLEVNAQPGRANRVLGKMVDRVLLGYEEGARWFAPGRSMVVGIPVSSAFTALGAARKPPVAGGALHVLVTGGSLGSGFLNQHAPEALVHMAANGCRVEVLHQAGKVADVEFARRDPRFTIPSLDRVAATYTRGKVPARVVPFIKDMAKAYEWADVAVTCAGVALAELAAAGVPALAVPMSEAAEDHQSANARAFARVSGLRWLSESQWTAEAVSSYLQQLAEDPGSWQATSTAMLSSGFGDSARRIVEACEALIGERHRELAPAG